VKTICTTNCTWSATVRMVNALVGELGDPATGGEAPLANAFPTSWPANSASCAGSAGVCRPRSVGTPQRLS